MRAARRLKDRIPWFLTFSPVSNTIAHLQTVAGELQEAETAKKLIETIFMPRRPLRLWRHQVRPKEYSINVDVALEDIRRIRLYEDNKKIFDSGVLGAGVDRYKKQLFLTSDYTIPQSTYRVEIEDYHGNVFEKGIPENDEITGNAFDPDLLLDLKGKILNCPRYAFRSVDYHHLDRVYPPFHDQSLEPDYYYETRMEKYVTYLREKGVIFASLYKYLGTEPTIEGYWRLLCEQDVSYQDQKYMLTKEENSALFLISADKEKLPINIQWDESELQELTDALSPSKKFRYIVESEQSTAADNLLIGQENLKWSLSSILEGLIASDSVAGEGGGNTPDSLKASDTQAGTGSGTVADVTNANDNLALAGSGTASENVKANDSVSGSSNIIYSDSAVVASDDVALALAEGVRDGATANDSISMSSSGTVTNSLRASDTVTGSTEVTSSDATATSDTTSGSVSGVASNAMKASDGGSCSSSGYICVFDTNTEFQQMSRSGTIISGTGTSAVLTVNNPSAGDTGVKYPTSTINVDYSNCASGWGYWYDKSYALSCNDTSAKADTTTTPCYTDILRFGGFSFGVPSNAKITGIQVAIRRRQSGTVNRVDQLVRIKVGGVNSANKADTSTYWPQSYTTKTYGGNGDLWGLSNVTPSNIDTLYLDLSAKDNYSAAGGTFYVDCAYVKVYYKVATSGTASYTLTGSDIGVKNNLGTLTVSCNIPEGSISYTVKKNNRTVKSGSLASGTNNIKLSEISVSSSSDSFNFIFQITSGTSSKPSIDYIKHYISISRTF